MYRLILLRHGETSYNIEGRMQGHLDVELTSRGRRQALAAAEALAGYQPAAIFSSDLRRARDTALAVAQACRLAVVTDSRLRETMLGSWQGSTREDVDQAFPGQRQRWRSDPMWAPPGGETQVDVEARGMQFVDEITARGVFDKGPVIIVAHGGFNVALTSGLLGIPVKLRPVVGRLDNCHWAELSTRPPHPDAPSPDRLSWMLSAWNHHAANAP